MLEEALKTTTFQGLTRMYFQYSILPESSTTLCPLFPGLIPHTKYSIKVKFSLMGQLPQRANIIIYVRTKSSH